MTDSFSRAQGDSALDDPTLDSRVLDRWLAGECTAAEGAAVAAWASARPGRVNDLDRLRHRVTAPFTYPNVTPPDQAWDEIRRRASTLNAAPASASSMAARGETRVARRLGVMGYGLALAAAALAIVAGTRWWSASTRERAAYAYATQRAQRATITLPDQSRLVLAPETRVEYTEDARGERTVALTGEAVLTVVHDPAHPFVVRTGTVTTRVLGTTFSVRHYPGDSDVRVAVVDGRVASGGRGPSLIMSAGQAGRITDSAATPLTGTAARAAVTWTDGRLIFDETAVPVMLGTLRRWYGYEFKLTDSALARRHVTTAFPINDSQKTLTALKELLNVTLEFHSDTVVLHPRTPRPSAEPRTRGAALDTGLLSGVGK